MPLPVLMAVSPVADVTIEVADVVGGKNVTFVVRCLARCTPLACVLMMCVSWPGQCADAEATIFYCTDDCGDPRTGSSIAPGGAVFLTTAAAYVVKAVGRRSGFADSGVVQAPVTGAFARGASRNAAQL